MSQQKYKKLHYILRNALQHRHHGLHLTIGEEEERGPWICVAIWKEEEQVDMQQDGREEVEECGGESHRQPPNSPTPLESLTGKTPPEGGGTKHGSGIGQPWENGDGADPAAPRPGRLQGTATSGSDAGHAWKDGNGWVQWLVDEEGWWLEWRRKRENER